MPKDSSVKYYQNNIERLQKRYREKYQSISMKKKENNDNMVVNDTKIFQKMKSKSLLSMEKNMIK